MSKLVLVNYRISDAEERETRRKIALIRSMLERCARLQAELAKLEPVAGRDWSETLDRYAKLVDASQWKEFVDEYNRLYDELPEVERRLQKELTDAKAKRLRLELTAATLLASAGTPAERKELEAISRGAGGLHGGKAALRTPQSSSFRALMSGSTTRVSREFPSSSTVCLRSSMLVDFNFRKVNHNIVIFPSYFTLIFSSATIRVSAG